MQERRLVVAPLSTRRPRLGPRPRRLVPRPRRLVPRPRRLVPRPRPLGPRPRRLATGRRSGRSRLIARRLALPVAAAVVVVVDQLTKSWAQASLVRDGLPAPRHLVGPLWLDLTYNSGAAFGLGRGVTPVVESIVVVIVGWLLLASRRAARSGSGLNAIGLGLLIGGAAGNLIDRFLRHNHGAVIDFIAAMRIGSKDWWPVFNVADAAIVIGVVLLAIGFVGRPARAADRGS